MVRNAHTIVRGLCECDVRYASYGLAQLVDVHITPFVLLLVGYKDKASGL